MSEQQPTKENPLGEIGEAKNTLPATFYLGVTELTIVEAGEKYKGLVISDSKTYDSTKKARTEMVTMRTSIAKALKIIQKPLKDQIDSNKDEAARLTGIVASYEDPLQRTVKAWEIAKAEEKRIEEEAEEKRKQHHIGRIEELRSLTAGCRDKNTASLEERMEHVKTLEPGEDYEEYIDEAKMAYRGTLTALQGLHDNAVAREQAAKAMEEQRLEQERVAKEQKAAQEEIDREKAERQHAEDELDEKVAKHEAWVKAEEQRIKDERAELEASKNPPPQQDPETPAEPEKQEKLSDETDESRDKTAPQGDEPDTLVPALINMAMTAPISEFQRGHMTGLISAARRDEMGIWVIREDTALLMTLHDFIEACEKNQE